MSDTETLMRQAEAWLAPLDGESGPCGPDLEYDGAFLELNTAAEGKAETQFERGAPPEWRQVREIAEGLLARTRDLRVAMLWLRAVVNLEGTAALLPGLRLVTGLLEAHWDGLHPRPDEGDDDTFARANVLAALPSMEGCVGDLLQARLTNIKGVGDLRLRDVEVAFGNLSARDGDNAYTREQLERMLADVDGGLWQVLSDVQLALRQLGTLMDQKFGAGSGAELKPALDLFAHVLGLRPAVDVAGGDAAAEAGLPGLSDGAVPTARPATAGLSGSVNSRAEAVRAIELVCAYLDRHEPTNPAQLFLRRARSLLELNFLELMKELAPNSLDEVARIVGVDPSSVGNNDS